MKKLLIVMAVALLALALVACGGETATTTQGAPAVTTAAPEITTTPATTETPATTAVLWDTTKVAPETTAVPEVPATSVPVTTAAPEVPLTSAPVTTTAPVETVDPIDLGAIMGSNQIETQGIHDNNLVIAFYLGDADAFGTLFGAFDSVTGSNGLCTIKEGYTAEVVLNGVAKTDNRFSYYAFDGGNGWFRFELGAFADLSTNGISFTMNASLKIKDAAGNVVCFADFTGLKYSLLSYEADADNPGKDALVVTPISGPDMDGGEGTKKLFDNKTTSKICKSDRTPIIFSLESAKALGGLSLVTANDNQSYTGRIVNGFTLYGADSADAAEWTTVLAVTDAGMADVNYTEYYYAIEGASAYQYYKIVFDGTNLFQFSEMWVYEAGDVVSDGKMPTSGLVKVPVDVTTVVFSNEYWTANPPKDAFDGNTVNTKLGTNKAASQPVTLEFSLVEPATITWYTFWSGNDTIPRYAGRNPKSWVMYGKVNGEWVVLSEVAEPGMIEQWATPYNYKVENPVECKDYKIVFETSSDIFQLNEIELYMNDASVTSPVLSAIMEGAVVAFPHALGYNADVYRIRTTNSADMGQFGNEAMAEITKEGAYVWVKDITTGGEYVKYEIKELETARHCDLNVILEGFVPVAGTQYEFAIFFMTGASAATPNALHVLHFFYTIPQ